MNEQAARNVVLVRAMEVADANRQVVSDDDRAYASRGALELARWDARENQSEMTKALFLDKRAGLVLKKIGEQHPAFSQVTAARNWLLTLGLVLPGLAFFAGVFLDRIADPHRVDLLSSPLLLIIAWNLGVYAVLLVRYFAWPPGVRPTKNSWLARLAYWQTFRAPKYHQTLALACSRFTTEWIEICAPLTRARIARIVHLSSAGFAAGAVISLYLRGLGSDYQPGWESTYAWVTPERVHAALSVLFAPAAALFHLPGFSITQVQALRLPHGGAAGGGERWVLLYAATIILLVILPRLALALFARWQEIKLAGDLPLDLGQPYFRRLTQSVGPAVPAALQVLPYSFTIDEVRNKGLTTVARMLLGEQAHLVLRSSTPYGEDWQDVAVGDPLNRTDVAHTFALFNLSATPEKENHGVFLEQILCAGVRGFSAMIDESAYLERVGAQSGGAVRVRERIALWRQFCEFHHVPSCIVNLVDPHQREDDIERGLISCMSSP